MCHVVPTLKALMLLLLEGTLLTLKIFDIQPPLAGHFRGLPHPWWSSVYSSHHPFLLLQAIVIMGSSPPLQFAMGGTIFHQPEALPLWFTEVTGFSSHALGGFLMLLHWWGLALILSVCLGIPWHMRNFVPPWLPMGGAHPHVVQVLSVVPQLSPAVAHPFIALSLPLFLLPPLAVCTESLKLIVQYLLCVPEYSTSQLDGKLVMDFFNLEAS
jgi:hypothetical protein